MDNFLFPYDEIRPIQEDLIKEVDSCIANKKNLIVHAPTGLGKTAASLAPALAHAIKNNLKVFFLTSRHTQHAIAIETLKQIKSKHNIDVVSVDIIGKKWMCPVPGTDDLFSNEFTDYCKSQREDMKCEFYVNCRKKSGRETIKAQKAVGELKANGPCHCDELINYCSDAKICPYEILALLAKSANVIIADYYYLFHPSIRTNFFGKAEIDLGNSVIIVDEAHNLPSRARDLLTSRLSNFTLKNAIMEAKKNGFLDSLGFLEQLRSVFDHYLQKLRAVESVQKENIDEILVLKDDFFDMVSKIANYDEIITKLEFDGDQLKNKKKRSFIGSIAVFLEDWLGPDQSFARILSKKETKNGLMVTLSYRGLDPAVFTKEVVNNSHSTILMSGTLTPTSMYRDLLGFDPGITVEKEFSSPFPKENRLGMIVPETTTRYAERSQGMFEKIAEITSKITNLVPGNSAIFFPSYKLMTEINRFFQPLSTKTCFTEQPGLSKSEKEDLLERFSQYKNSGAVLLGVAAGSFSQGVDFPGDLLKAVVVVGLPLQRPDLETKELIDYYEKKFRHGWDYGYVFPAITKCLQSAGRCIRSETDKGVIIFLDKRFAWSNYSKCFPPDLNLRVTSLYENNIKNFFAKNGFS